MYKKAPAQAKVSKHRYPILIKNFNLKPAKIHVSPT